MIFTLDFVLILNSFNNEFPQNYMSICFLWGQKATLGLFFNLKLLFDFSLLSSLLHLRDL